MLFLRLISIVNEARAYPEFVCSVENEPSCLCIPDGFCSSRSWKTTYIVCILEGGSSVMWNGLIGLKDREGSGMDLWKKVILSWHRREGKCLFAEEERAELGLEAAT